MPTPGAPTPGSPTPSPSDSDSNGIPLPRLPLPLPLPTVIPLPPLLTGTSLLLPQAVPSTSPVYTSDLDIAYGMGPR
ncbi:hypothetical protein [Actinopolymorpha pittospori]